MRRCFILLSCLFMIASLGCQETPQGDPSVVKPPAPEKDMEMKTDSNVQDAPPA